MNDVSTCAADSCVVTSDSVLQVLLLTAILAVWRLGTVYGNTCFMEAWYSVWQYLLYGGVVQCMAIPAV